MKKTFARAWSVFFFLAFSVLPLAAQTDSHDELLRLADDYWQETLRRSPMAATMIGEHQYDHLLDDLTPEARQKTMENIQNFKSRAQRIDDALLSEEDRITKNVLLELLDADQGRIEHKLYQWDVDHMYGPQISFPQVVGFMPLTSTKDVQNLIARFIAYPRYMEEYRANLKEGLTEGRVAAKITVERVMTQVRQILLQSPEASPLGIKTKSMPTGLYVLYGSKAIQGIRDSVYPALSQFTEFLEKDYLSQCRGNDAIGLNQLPGGATAYEFLIRTNTTLPLSAEELHQIGLKEIEKIHSEMLQIANKLGHQGTLAQFQAKIKSNPANYFQTRDGVLSSAKRNVERAYALLPKYFLSVPQVYCDVLAIEQYREKDAVAAFYYAPDDQMSRPGIYYVNTYNPSSRARYTMTALAAHEAVPGHHNQIATAIGLKSLPAFRRHADFTAFIEGWGLYAERLADEMGLYENELSRFGMLTYQAWRASRLVVDTGIHAKGWSRDRAIEFMKTNAPIPDQEIVNEVDRYIIWPGQALAYKTGQREIESLRREAEKMLGAKFDLREFHYMVLKNGAVPLPLLKKIIHEWLTAKLETSRQDVLNKQQISTP
ncbi:MAG: DUF885 domain-containing protein [Elusimicrobia bacterium]|nr:DUF885 domain-containing protein [Elusimicrobiota bacterium]